GGSEPQSLAAAARLGEASGFDEINLNVGCPSGRVQSGAFGACLMKTPEIVRDCVAAMRAAVRIPVTVKCRIGVDDQIPEESLFTLVDLVAGAGCETFIVHARKALLDGLSPKENRSVPPLEYDLVRRLKRERPDLTIVLNGGIETINQAQILSQDCDGVMLGRAAYGEPYILATVDEEFFGNAGAAPSREEVALQMSEYLKQQFELGVRAHSVTRHMLGLYHGAPGARVWRRYISEHAPLARGDILDGAVDAVRAVRVDA
ncbi:MAG: tRNA dihydrouridine(20/20a) synthase DusA, partial [Marinicaulis sp.]|nr:tRNA dihydrouridine(20/20a) synthase DusA [Marinicaulis sp.]